MYIIEIQAKGEGDRGGLGRTDRESEKQKARRGEVDLNRLCYVLRCQIFVMILTVDTRVGQKYTLLHVFLRRRRRRVLVHERVSYWESDECYAKGLVENLYTKHDLLIMYSAITSNRFRFQVALSTANSRARQAHATLASQHPSSTETAKGSAIYRKIYIPIVYAIRSKTLFSHLHPFL